MKNKINEFFNKLKGKKILIQGLGLNGGGVGTALFFLKHDIPVTITDLKSEKELLPSIKLLEEYQTKITYKLGSHDIDDFLSSDLIIKGPGIPPHTKYISAAHDKGIQITSDIEIFMKLCPCPVYAVTGSKGKSSTVSAIYSIFKEYNSSNSYIGGNITISPLNFLEQLNQESKVILELSSWQLRDIKDKGIKFKIAAITNLLNDHQNYYNSMEDYLEEKLVITDNQDVSDILIIPKKDNYVKSEKINSKPTIYHYGENGDIFYNSSNEGYIEPHNVTLFNKDDIKIPGIHLQGNLLLAASICFLAGIPINKIQSGIRNFKGTDYRLQHIKNWKGIDFYNDTTATIPIAAVNAIKSFDRPIIWIAGGNDKNLDFTPIKEIESMPKNILFLSGDGTEKIKKLLTRSDYIEGNSLEELMRKAVEFANPGDIILLSPGCTSFGLFQNEFHRGEIFNNWIKANLS